jgi:hypothetical protein
MPEKTMSCPSCSRRGFLTRSVACASVSVFAKTGLAIAGPCDVSAPKVAISVQAQTPQPVWRSDLGRAQLAQMFAKSDGALAARVRHGERPAGLTLATYATTWRIEVLRAHIGGELCSAVGRIEVDVVLRDHQSFLASEFADPNVCAHAIVLRHEAEHAKINIETANEAAEAIRRTLASDAQRLPVLPGILDADKAVERYLSMVRPAVEKSLAGAFSAGNRRHSILDSDYMRAIEWASCRT